jgi:hypothetical protein
MYLIDSTRRSLYKAKNDHGVWSGKLTISKNRGLRLF